VTAKVAATTGVPSSYKAVASWEGFPFSADDISGFASEAIVALSNPKFEVAAQAINRGIQAFVLACQPVSAPGDFASWYKDIAKKSVALLSLFGGSAEDARRSFLHHPSAYSKAGLEYDDFPRILGDLQKLSVAATLAEQLSDSQKRGGRRPVRPRLCLKNGLQNGWEALTAKRTGGISKPPKAGDPYGPFIFFCAATLNEAANRLSNSLYSPNHVAVDELRTIAAQPNSIAEFQLSGRRGV
jgi:hypothetical protein